MLWGHVDKLTIIEGEYNRSNNKTTYALKNRQNDN